MNNCINKKQNVKANIGIIQQMILSIAYDHAVITYEGYNDKTNYTPTVRYVSAINSEWFRRHFVTDQKYHR